MLRLWLGLLFASGVSPAQAQGSTTKALQQCMSIGPTDALVVVDVQNCFMQARPLPGGSEVLQYSIPAEQTVVIDGKPHIGAGSLQVAGSKDIIAPINEWMAHFDSAGAHVAVTQDWHPPDHCSFCRWFGLTAEGTVSKGRMVAAYQPAVQQHANVTLANRDNLTSAFGVCQTGAGTNTFVKNWESGRCKDAVSRAEYNTGAYFMWPDHCVQHQFGAELDPRLVVPSSAVNFKIGFDQDYDNYTSLHGRMDPAGGGGGGSSMATLRSGQTLEAWLRNVQARRLFVVGIATDYVVKQTVLDALDAAGVLPGVLEVVVPENLTRGVFAHTSAQAFTQMKRDGARVISMANGHLTGALDELCTLRSFSCFTHLDCDVRSTWTDRPAPACKPTGWEGNPGGYFCASTMGKRSDDSLVHTGAFNTCLPCECCNPRTDGCDASCPIKVPQEDSSVIILISCLIGMILLVFTGLLARYCLKLRQQRRSSGGNTEVGRKWEPRDRGEILLCVGLVVLDISDIALDLVAYIDIKPGTILKNLMVVVLSLGSVTSMINICVAVYLLARLCQEKHGLEKESFVSHLPCCGKIDKFEDQDELAVAISLGALKDADETLKKTITRQYRELVGRFQHMKRQIVLSLTSLAIVVFEDLPSIIVLSLDLAGSDDNPFKTSGREFQLLSVGFSLVLVGFHWADVRFILVHRGELARLRAQIRRLVPKKAYRGQGPRESMRRSTGTNGSAGLQPSMIEMNPVSSRGSVHFNSPSRASTSSQRRATGGGGSTSSFTIIDDKARDSPRHQRIKTCHARYPSGENGEDGGDGDDGGEP